MSADLITSSTFADSPLAIRTPNDLAQRFGDIPLERIRFTPRPGTATEEGVERIRDRERRLYELVDGTLIEKAMGTYESLIAGNLHTELSNFLKLHRLGIALLADGLLRLKVALIRIPDVAYISRERLRQGKFPRQGIATLVPGIAAEVISQGNTGAEMEGKLDEYFGVNVREVWYLYPQVKELHRYESRDRRSVLSADSSIVTPLLPGFVCPLAPLFVHPDEQFAGDLPAEPQ